MIVPHAPAAVRLLHHGDAPSPTLERVDRPAPQLIPDPDVPGAWVVRVGGADQSWVDPADPSHLEFYYMQQIAGHLDLAAPKGERLRVVHIGGGGMSLARYIAHTRPRSAQVVCEPHEELTALVREHAPLPRNSGIKVRPVDGRTGLAAMPENYAEVVVVDAFVGAVVPPELTTVEAFAEVRRVLGPRGLLLMNITDKAPFAWARRVLAGIGRYFPHRALTAQPATLKGRRRGNLVLAASRVPLPERELSERAARAVFAQRLVAGGALASLVGGAQPLHDGTAESPVPSDPMLWL